MAERRMFSKRITSSAKFVKMPSSTQNLYWHIGINADDDGVAEAYNIMNMIGATEDDLKILVAKNFVKVLNEDLVVFITDWRENNRIRSDRKVDSIYKNLLLQVDPQVELQVSKPRADAKNKQMTTNGRPEDNQRSAQVRLGKDSIGKFSTGQIKDEEEEEINKSLTREREFPNPEQIFENTPQIEQLSLKLLSDFMVDSPEQASICIEALSGQYWRLRRLKDEGNSIVVLKEQAYGIDKGILNIIEEAAKYSLEHTKERLNDFNSFGSYFSTGLINKINTAISSGGNNDATV